MKIYVTFLCYVLANINYFYKYFYILILFKTVMHLKFINEKRYHRLLYAFMVLTCLLFANMSVYAQGIQVSGVVSDEYGETLPGVNVLEKGTMNGVVTDVNGNYSITVQGSDAVLQFTYVGYNPQDILVGNQQRIMVTMTESSTALDEVVVIGYGTQRKEAVTGSVATMKGDELTRVPSGNITQALQGRIAGVEMSQSSTKPGAAMQIRIRGQRSLTASNDPLIVLDGIPFAGTISDIDPSSIRSIDILKDASATAIYGSRGANGVIMITSTKGVMGARAKVSYNGYYGAKNAIRAPMMTGPQLYELKQYLGTAPAGTTGIYTNLGPDEKADADTDWQELLLRTGYVTSHDLNVAGGTTAGSYSIGGSYYLDQAVIPTSNYSRFSLRANIDQGVGNYFRFGLISNSNYNTTNGNQLGFGLDRSPLFDIYNADGSLKERVSSSADNNVWVYTRKTIEANKDRWVDQTRSFGTYNNVYAEISQPWIEGLKYRVNVGLNFITSAQGTFRGQGINDSNPLNLSTASMDNRWTTNWAIENLLTFDRTFAEKHTINIVGLYSSEQTTYNRTNMSGRDIPDENFQFWNIGRAEDVITVSPENQDYWQSGLISWMGRVMYSYDNKYMLSAAIRSDGSSRLAPGFKWNTYPAVSAGWNIHRESFMNDISLINSLKLRVGYGQTSNQAIDPYKTLGLLATRDYNFDDQFMTGYYVSQLPNTQLGWEFSKTWNFGLDFSLLNSRLSGTIEYYSQKTDNVLQSVNLPVTSGVSSYTANIGKTENKGFELILNGVILDNLNGWTWDAGFNFYINRNKLTELASGAKRDEGNRWFVGYPIDCIFDYEAIGLWQEGDAFMNDFEPGTTPGSIRVKYVGELDSSGKPARTIGQTPGEGTDDRQIMSMEPDFQGGFNTRVAYKGFDLSIVGSFKSGGILISTLYQGNGYLNNLWGRRGQLDVDYWRPDNTGAKWPNPWGLRSSDNIKYMNSMGYFNASYLKINTITLGYNFNVSGWGVERARIYVTAQNPFVLFSPYHKQSGMDPEPNARLSEGSYMATGSSANLSRILVVGTNTPTTRNFLVGLSLTF